MSDWKSEYLSFKDPEGKILYMLLHLYLIGELTGEQKKKLKILLMSGKFKKMNELKQLEDKMNIKDFSSFFKGIFAEEVCRDHSQSILQKAVGFANQSDKQDEPFNSPIGGGLVYMKKKKQKKNN